MCRKVNSCCNDTDDHGILSAWPEVGRGVSLYALYYGCALAKGAFEKFLLYKRVYSRHLALNGSC